ncbi:DMT family transporter [Achromobacter denitrificans]
MSDHARAIGAAALTGALVGAAMVATRAVSADTTAETLAFLRYAIGLALLLPPALRRWSARFSVRDIFAMGGLGILQFAILMLLLNHALATLPAATCALVFSTVPLLTMCLAVCARRERFSRTRLAGAVIAVAGIAVLLAPAAGPAREAGDAWAWASLLGATFVGAACSILYRPYLRKYPALCVSAYAMSVSVAFLAAVCLVNGASLVPRLSAFQWANVIFIGLSSGVGYFCLLWALGRLDASRVMAFQALAPITAVLIELLGAAYPPAWRLAGAFILVLSGVWIGSCSMSATPNTGAPRGVAPPRQEGPAQ